MPIDVLPWVRTLLAQLGLEGVSALTLLLLLTLALWARKGARYGGKAASVGSSAVTYTQAVALVLATLLLLGVVHADVQRGQELLGIFYRHLQTTVWNIVQDYIGGLAG